MSDILPVNEQQILSAQALSVGYASHTLASALNLSLLRGRLTCLLGPNGVGKSTLINTLAGYLSPLTGKVLLGGHPLQDYDPQQRSQLVSVVLTDRIQADNLRAFDLVAMGRSPYTGFWGRLSSEDKRIVAESLDMVGMTHFAQRQFSSLSDGEKQKVLIAKAIAQQTPIIILDEPTAFLDYPSKVRTLLLLSRLAHQMNKAILLSTHDMEQSLALADELWLMTPGKGVLTGSVSELTDNGALSACFDCEEMRYNPALRRFDVMK